MAAFARAQQVVLAAAQWGIGSKKLLCEAGSALRWPTVPMSLSSPAAVDAANARADVDEKQLAAAAAAPPIEDG